MSERTDIPAQEPVGDSITRNTFFALVVQVTTATFTAALTLFLVRALEPEGYGVFALVIGIGLVLTLPSDLGISASAARFIAEQRAHKSVVAAILVDALKLKLIAAVLVSTALFFSAAPIADAYQNPDLTWPLRGVSIALFAQSIFMLFSGAFTALGRISLNLRAVFTESSFETFASIALVLVGTGATGAVFGRAAGYLIGSVAAAWLMVRFLGRKSFSKRSDRHIRAGQILRYAGALFIIDGAFTLFSEIDVLLIGAMLSVTSVGLFQAPMRLITFLHYPGMALASGVAPRLAKEDIQRPDSTALNTSLRYLVMIQSLMVAPVVVWSDPIIELLLGPEYKASAEVLRALAPFVFLAGIAPIVSISVNYLGEARRRIPVAIVAVVVNFVIDIVLIPKIGIVAGAIGTNVAYLIYVGAHIWILKRLVKLPLRPLIITLLRCTVAATATAALLAALGTSTLSLADYLIGGVFGTSVFIFVLLLTRELKLLELQAAIRTVLRLK